MKKTEATRKNEFKRLVNTHQAVDWEGVAWVAGILLSIALIFIL